MALDEPHDDDIEIAKAGWIFLLAPHDHLFIEGIGGVRIAFDEKNGGHGFAVTTILGSGYC